MLCNALKSLGCFKAWNTGTPHCKHLNTLLQIQDQMLELHMTEVFERGHSWNVNTAKEIQILQPPWLPCKYSFLLVIIIIFICQYSCELKVLSVVLVPFCMSPTVSLPVVIEFLCTPSLIRLHGCCSWCRFVWLKSLKKKNGTEKWDTKEIGFKKKKIHQNFFLISWKSVAELVKHVLARSELVRTVLKIWVRFLLAVKKSKSDIVLM